LSRERNLFVDVCIFLYFFFLKYFFAIPSEANNYNIKYIRWFNVQTFTGETQEFRAQ